MGLNILHLSDLHLSNNTDAKDLAAKIHNALIDQHKLTLDVIIVTGDIFDAKCFSSANYDVSINKAIEFFECLSSHIKINNFEEQLFFVPGNHEINRDLPEPLNRYREFLAKIYKEKWNDIAQNIYDKDELCFLKYFADKQVILIGLNSPRYEELKKEGVSGFIETARIGNTQINSIKKQIRMIDERDDCRVVVCLHNNIYNTLEYSTRENIDSTCLQDNDALLSMLNNYNCSLILHGHKHQQKNRRINLTQDIKGKDHLCTVIGGGKLSDSFNYLEIYDTDSDIDLYCMKFRDETGAFILDDEFSVPIQESKRRFSKMIEDALQSDPKLNMAYKLLKDTDTNCDPKLTDMFDTILGSFREISDVFFNNNSLDFNLLYIVLGTIHYRSNYDIKDGFLMQSEEFIKEATDKSSLSDTVIEMLKIEDVRGLHCIYEKSKKNNPLFGKHRKALIFLALSIYLAEFFITIKKRPNKFFTDHIQEKANYNLGGDDIKPSINGNTIKFEVNEEHRALEISVRCITANSHKVVSLIIKEFELVLSKFEEDFASVGFRVYYALPKLTKADIDDEEYESYEFGAFIPQLIPLLAGRNIYSEPEAFTRELIQNSIDAIKVREKSSEHKDMFSTDIELEIKEDDKSGLKYFKITDQGTGMNRYVLERYLTTIGRSFYTSSDFKKLGIAYSPISKFGIGFLSCFMLGKQVKVYTTYHDDLNKTFNLDIPNYDGCFFIETKNEEKAIPGSSITVWEKSEPKEKKEQFDIEKIKTYINKMICNIPFDITLNEEEFIPKFYYYNRLINETKKNKILFFIPLLSDPVVSDQDTNNDILIDKEITGHSEHGIYFFKTDRSLDNVQDSIVMNNGILVNQSKLEAEAHKIHPYLDVAFNFPSHTLELEVSRDKLKSLHNFDTSNFRNVLRSKIKKYLKSGLSKNLKYFYWHFLDRGAFKLSKINISITDKTLIVNMNKYSPFEELDNFCKLIEKADDSKKKIYDAASHGSIFEYFYDDINFGGETSKRFEMQMKLSVKYRDKTIRSFQDQFFNSRLNSGTSSMSLLQRYSDLAGLFSGKLGKIVSQLILESGNEYFSHLSVRRIREMEMFPSSVRRIREMEMFPSSIRRIREIAIFPYSRALIIMSILKCLLSIKYTHSQLSEGFSIPLEEV